MLLVMKYFEYINIPQLEQIQKQVLHIANEKLNNPTVIFDNKKLYQQICNIKELKSFLIDANWFDHLLGITLYVMDKESSFDIHIDTPAENYNVARLLVPIKGCDNTFTQFYTSDVEPITEWIYPNNDTPKPFHKFDKDKCKFVTEAEMTRPFLIHHQHPHGIYNPNNNLRVSLWIDFDAELDLLQYISDMEFSS